jgi:small basic protein
MSTEMPPSGRDPATGSKLQILATEHWSLLATRSLIYQESLGRVNMFLGILSGAVIALALVAQATHFSTAFYAAAIFMLAVVFFTGVATIRRLMMLNRDDYQMVVGMNRLRHGYFDLHPELEPYFITSSYDDLGGALRTLGLADATAQGLGNFWHGFVTLPGTVGVIVASVGGAIGGLAAIGFGAPAYGAIIAGAAAFLATELMIYVTGRRSFRRFGPSQEPRFPTPK